MEAVCALLVFVRIAKKQLGENLCTGAKLMEEGDLLNVCVALAVRMEFGAGYYDTLFFLCGFCRIPVGACN